MSEATETQEVDRNYPRVLYKRGQDPLTVHNEQEETAAAADGWVDSPADYGVETQPARGRVDPNIAKNRPPAQGQQPKK